MTVTLDVERTWKVQCDQDCGARLYLVAEDAEGAALRASAHFGWTRDSDGRIYCRAHREA